MNKVVRSNPGQSSVRSVVDAHPCPHASLGRAQTQTSLHAARQTCSTINTAAPLALIFEHLREQLARLDQCIVSSQMTSSVLLPTEPVEPRIATRNLPGESNVSLRFRPQWARSPSVVNASAKNSVCGRLQDCTKSMRAESTMIGIPHA